MNISHIKGADRVDVWTALCAALAASRFDATLSYSGRDRIKVQLVRLQQSKHYCGNHPKACEGLGGAHSSRKYLEGADWIEFHDTILNDTLDALNVSADVANTQVVVREGTRRRVGYFADQREANGTWIWNRTDPGYFEDYCGKVAPRSEFPQGTPGIYTSIGYYCIGHHDHHEHEQTERLVSPRPRRAFATC